MNEVNKKIPKVSIGMPIYNAEKFLKQSLDSLLTQTFTDFEIIISDNASEDNTENICREYAAKDSRIHYFRQDINLGAAWNYNKVFELSKGIYFKWLPADDVCAPEFLEKCLVMLEDDPLLVLAYALTKEIDEVGNLLPEDLYMHGSTMKDIHANSDKVHERFRYLMCLSHLSFPLFGVMRSKILGKTSLIGNYVSSDQVLLSQLSLYGKFFEVSEPLFFRRRHKECSSSLYRSVYTKAAWFDPAKKDKPTFPEWRTLKGYLDSLKSSRLKTFDKFMCYLQIGRWLWRHWKRMARDIYVFLRFKINPEWNVYKYGNPYYIECGRLGKPINKTFKEGE